MPIIENDPWRYQYFNNVSCPDSVQISTDDPCSYTLYPEHRWVYNKMKICETQGIEHAPHGVMPKNYPVFSKPIYNLNGMGVGAYILNDDNDYYKYYQPGHFWMELFTGEHVSSDAAVVDGIVKWWRHTIGIPKKGGTFDYWIIQAEVHEKIEEYCNEWMKLNLRSYSGMINFETIGGRIIEAHLRVIDQWPDLYGEHWINSVVELYANNNWQFEDKNRRTGYSVILFSDQQTKLYKHPPENLINEIKNMNDISSIQITFHENPVDFAKQPAPPGGMRLAVINCFNLKTGFKAREKLANYFFSNESCN